MLLLETKSHHKHNVGIVAQPYKEDSLLHLRGNVFRVMLWTAACSATIEGELTAFRWQQWLLQMHHKVMLYERSVSCSHLHCHSSGTKFRMHTLLLPSSLPFFLVLRVGKVIMTE